MAVGDIINRNRIEESNSPDRLLSLGQRYAYTSSQEVTFVPDNFILDVVLTKKANDGTIRGTISFSAPFDTTYFGYTIGDVNIIVRKDINTAGKASFTIELAANYSEYECYLDSFTIKIPDGYLYEILNSSNNVRAYKNSNIYQTRKYTDFLQIPSTFTNNGTTYTVTSLEYCFAEDKYLQYPSFSIPTTVTSMSYCFYRCNQLRSAPTIPSSVIDLRGCFGSCSTLSYIPSIPTSVSRMIYCFSGCNNIKNLSNFTFKTTCDYSFCFSDSGLEQIENNVIVENSAYLYYCFSNCSNLRIAKFDSFSTNTYLYGSFYNCKNLVFCGVKRNLEDTAYQGFIIASAYNKCFEGCQSLTGTYYIDDRCSGSTGSIFSNTILPIYLVRDNNSVSSSVINQWKNVANSYSNVHFEGEDNAAPNLISVSAKRSNSSGNEDLGGSYITVSIKPEIFSNLLPEGFSNSIKNLTVSSNNGSEPLFENGVKQEGVKETSDETPGSNLKFYEKTISITSENFDKRFLIEITLEDSCGHTTTYKVYIPAPDVLMEFKKGGKGIAIGTTAKENGLTIQYPTRIGRNLEFAKTGGYVLTEDTEPQYGKTYYAMTQSDNYEQINLMEYNFYHPSTRQIWKDGKVYSIIQVNNFSQSQGVTYYLFNEETLNYEEKPSSESVPIMGHTYYTKTSDTYEVATDTITHFTTGVTYYIEDESDEGYAAIGANYGYVRKGVTYFVKEGDEYIQTTVGFDPLIEYYVLSGSTYTLVADGTSYVNGTIYYQKVEESYQKANVGFDSEIDYYYRNNNNVYILVTDGTSYSDIDYYTQSDGKVPIEDGEQYIEEQSYYFRQSDSYVLINTIILENNGVYEFKEGITTDLNNTQLIIGNYNVLDTDAIFVAGGGNSVTTRKNGITINKEGRLIIPYNTSVWFRKSNGTDYFKTMLYSYEDGFHLGNENENTIIRGKTLYFQKDHPNPIVMNGTISITGKTTINSGGLAVSAGGATISGGLTVKTGNISISSGGLSTSGNIAAGASIYLKNEKYIVGYMKDGKTARVLLGLSNANNVFVGSSTNACGLNLYGSSINLKNNATVTGYILPNYLKLKNGASHGIVVNDKNGKARNLLYATTTNNIVLGYPWYHGDTSGDCYVGGKTLRLMSIDGVVINKNLTVNGTVNDRSMSLLLQRSNITMTEHSGSTGTVEAGSYKSSTITVTKDGYYPYGVVGFNMAGTNRVSQNIYSCQLTTRETGKAVVTYAFKNTLSSTSFSGTMYVHILWIQVL